MKSIGMYYFSGTSNTYTLSVHMKKSFEDLGVSVMMQSISKDIQSISSETIASYDAIGIGYPIYGFGTPEIIFEFVNSLPEVKSKNVFIYKTAGDYIFINHAASYDLIKVLSQKGYTVFYDRIFAMGSNWVVEYDKRLVKQLYLAALGKIEHMTKEVMGFKKRLYKPSVFLRVFARVTVYFEHRFGARSFGKSLYANDKCTKCMKCVRSCPNKNITLNEEIKFGSNCLWCMRCVYECPQNAIKSKSMSFCIHKNGYSLESIINDDTRKPNFITKDTKGFFKHFYKYILDESM